MQDLGLGTNLVEDFPAGLLLPLLKSQGWRQIRLSKYHQHAFGLDWWPDRARLQHLPALTKARMRVELGHPLVHMRAESDSSPGWLRP